MLGVGGYAPPISQIRADAGPGAALGIYNAEAAGEPALEYGFRNAEDVIRAAMEGKIDPYKAYELTSTNKSLEFQLTEAQEKLLDNLLARYQSQHALTWQAEQLQALGLSNAGVLQTGAAHTAQSQVNAAANRADRMKSIANSLISMTSRAIGAGIHGAAIQGLKDTTSAAIEGVVRTHRSQINNFDRTGRLLGSTVRFDTDSQRYR